MKKLINARPYFLLLILLILSSASVNAFGQNAKPQAYQVGTAASDAAPRRSLERDVFELINKEREKNNLPALAWNTKVAEIARLHSKDMGWHNYFNHRSLDGKMVNDRADASGMDDWQMIGENIAMLGGFSDPIQHVVEGWMQSPGHRRNILDPRWKETGIGLFITNDGTYYFTQVFLSKE